MLASGRQQEQGSGLRPRCMRRAWQGRVRRRGLALMCMAGGVVRQAWRQGQGQAQGQGKHLVNVETEMDTTQPRCSTQMPVGVQMGRQGRQQPPQQLLQQQV